MLLQRLFGRFFGEAQRSEEGLPPGHPSPPSTWDLVQKGGVFTPVN